MHVLRGGALAHAGAESTLALEFTAFTADRAGFTASFQQGISALLHCNASRVRVSQVRAGDHTHA